MPLPFLQIFTFIGTSHASTVTQNTLIKRSNLTKNSPFNGSFGGLTRSEKGYNQWARHHMTTIDDFIAIETHIDTYLDSSTP